MSHRLGNLSMKYETGFRPGQEAKACGVVSTGLLGQGKADPGGKSYGAYQLTSTVQAGQRVLAFLRADGARWLARFTGRDPTRAGKFESVWKLCAAEDPDAFFAAQHDFIKRTHFDVVVGAVKKLTRIDCSTRSPGVCDVIWSMSVQHGRAAQLIVATVEALKARVPVDDPGYDRALINALFDRREDYVRPLGLDQLIRNRYVPERRDALAMLT